MKKATLLSVMLLTVLVILCSMLSANALNSNEWTWTYAWSSATYYQGDSGTITITFYSTCPDQLQISYVGVNFDWMTPNTYYQLDLSSNPVGIATNGQYTFSAISFSIPAAATVGSHSFTLLLQGQEQGLLGWYSISVTGTGSINVLDAYEKIYDQTFQSVQTSLTNAENSNYQSPDAQALLQQASNMYNQATSLANQNQWQAAVNDLNTASNDLSQAAAQEAEYTPPATPTPTAPEFPPIAVLSVFLVLSILAVAVLTIRKRKISKS